MTASQRGFTLLELLISIVLLALLTTMLFGGLQLGTRQLDRQTDRVERAARLSLAQGFLRRQLADARPLADPAQAAGIVAFTGERDSLRFFNPTPASAASGGLESLSVEFVEGHGRSAGALLLRRRSDEAGAAAHDSVLLDQVRQAEFAYFGVTAPGETAAWHASWRDMAYLPSLVRLSVVFSDGAVMPEMIVALRLSPGAAGQWAASGAQ
ncbi:MAG TPA: prepilin-type N-terminal cleavage/methylation domain-containing protein [Stellaceae bacterium]|nr:prepilin-type N-terminal cleavage/methylation domain-containing protein [Stellaceae bacterium]